jgi:hypothetical protein
MQENRPCLGYALNAFPCETFEDWWTCLNTEVLAIKQRVFPHSVFPVELRFSERLLRELTCDRVAQWKYFFDTHDILPVTVNAFVMPHFHGERVKERVYLPAWHESPARLEFTNASVDILTQLTAEHTTVSVPFGALKPVPMAATAPNILKAGEHAAAKGCVVALEPEPGLCVETTDEVIEFFRAYVPQSLRENLAVNFDLSHQLVQFEDLQESVARLLEAGIRIAKIHVSNAAELTELKPFYEDSIYLHQVTGVGPAGRYFSLDWPATAPTGITKYRCHYHLPVYPTALPSTLREVERFLSNLPAIHASTPIIIETYTWPEQLRGRAKLVDNICRELEWVRERIAGSWIINGE